MFLFEQSYVVVEILAETFVSRQKSRRDKAVCPDFFSPAKTSVHFFLEKNSHYAACLLL